METRTELTEQPASLYQTEPFSTREWEERNRVLGPVPV